MTALTGGDSLAANIQLVLNNARLAAAIAIAYADEQANEQATEQAAERAAAAQSEAATPPRPRPA